MAAVAALRDRLADTTHCRSVGCRRGPGRAACRTRSSPRAAYGLRISEDPEAARGELESAVQSAAEQDPFLRRNPRRNPPVVSWPGGQFLGGRLSAGDPLRSQVLNAHATVTGGAPTTVHGARWGSDLRLYAAAGIPTVHYGPGDVRPARTERVGAIGQVLTSARVLLQVLQSDLSAHG